MGLRRYSDDFHSILHFVLFLIKVGLMEGVRKDMRREEWNEEVLYFTLQRARRLSAGTPATLCEASRYGNSVTHPCGSAIENALEHGVCVCVCVCVCI